MRHFPMHPDIKVVMHAARERFILDHDGIHDSCREDDGSDSDHGTRAAEFAEYLASRNVLKISADQMDLLTTACRLHSDGLIPEDVTISTCWDADRLDLGRIYIRPDPIRLCTEAARDPQTIEWAWRRSHAWLRKSRASGQRF
jgi:uncharacterized protein